MAEWPSIAAIDDAAEYEEAFWAEVEAREAEEAERDEAEGLNAQEQAMMDEAFQYMEWAKVHPILAWISNQWWSFYHWVRRDLMGQKTYWWEK